MFLSKFAQERWNINRVLALERIISLNALLEKMAQHYCWCGFLECLLVYFEIHLFMYLFLAVLGLHCCTWLFSSCSEQGLLSSCDAQASHLVASLVDRTAAGHMSFSTCGSRALGYRLDHCGLNSCDLVAPWNVGSSQIRDQICISHIGRQILYHWATREAPNVCWLKQQN